MAKKRTDPPAIRETEVSIEIDAERGKWPFMKAVWGHDQDGRVRLLLVVDCNEGGQIVGENANVGIVAISRKKAAKLRDFLSRTLELTPE